MSSPPAKRSSISCYQLEDSNVKQPDLDFSKIVPFKICFPSGGDIEKVGSTFQLTILTPKVWLDSGCNGSEWRLKEGQTSTDLSLVMPLAVQHIRGLYVNKEAGESSQRSNFFRIDLTGKNKPKITLDLQKEVSVQVTVTDDAESETESEGT